MNNKELSLSSNSDIIHVIQIIITKYYLINMVYIMEMMIKFQSQNSLIINYQPQILI